MLALGLSGVAFANDEESSPIAPQSFDGFGGDPQLAFAPATGESRPYLVAAGPKAPAKKNASKLALRSKTKGKWVTAKELKAKQAAAKAPVKPKKVVAKGKKPVKKSVVAKKKANSGRKIAAVVKKAKKPK